MDQLGPGRTKEHFVGDGSNVLIMKVIC